MYDLQETSQRVVFRKLVVWKGQKGELLTLIGVWGLGFGAWGLEFGVWGLGIWVSFIRQMVEYGSKFVSIKRIPRLRPSSSTSFGLISFSQVEVQGMRYIFVNFPAENSRAHQTR